MKKVQQWHDRLCEEFADGNVPLDIFLVLDAAFDHYKTILVYMFNEN